MTDDQLREAMLADAERCNARYHENADGRPSRPTPGAQTLEDAVRRSLLPTPQSLLRISDKAGVNEMGTRHALRRLMEKGIAERGPDKPARGHPIKTYRRVAE